MEFSEIKFMLPCPLYSRNAHYLVSDLGNIKSRIIASKEGGDGRLIDMKSILGLLSICCEKGDVLDIVCRSQTKEQAESDLAEVINAIEGLGDR